MTTTKLPTLYKWASELLAHRRAILIALLFFGAFMIIRKNLKRYFAVVLSCDQPCQDAVSCDPLELTFEVIPQKISVAQPQPLWYRAQLKNRSCRILRELYVKEFLDSTRLKQSTMGLWVTVTDQAGQEVERRPIPGPDGGIAWHYGASQGTNVSTQGIIYPYQPDYGLIEELRLSKKMGDTDFIALDPGESFASIPFRLRPYRILAASVKIGDGIGDGTAKIAVKNPPDFPQPPEGYSLLDGYALKRLGHYRVTAGFEAEVRILPVYSRWASAPRWLRPFLRQIGLQPELYRKSDRRKVSIVAPSIPLEVIR